ncbi:luciferase-like monooxygenase [Klebsiella pneumoniae]|nr:luciferase-like monooxygenase [Klebsiella pneumoniae]
MVGIASAATSVLIGYLAANTTTLHLGSGGVMLPNHSPLVIAEQFGTLNTLYPGGSTSALAARRAAISRPCAPCVAI